eukprot:6468565-Amphidinium_carterae.1
MPLLFKRNTSDDLSCLRFNVWPLPQFSAVPGFQPPHRPPVLPSSLYTQMVELPILTSPKRGSQPEPGSQFFVAVSTQHVVDHYPESVTLNNPRTRQKVLLYAWPCVYH